METFSKKKIIFVIFGRFKKGNPRAVGTFRRILDRNVVVSLAFEGQCAHEDKVGEIKFDEDYGLHGMESGR